MHLHTSMAIELPPFHTRLAPDACRDLVIRPGGRNVRPRECGRRPDDMLARLKYTFSEAGWLVDLDVIQTIWGPRLTFRNGLGLDHVDELILTVEAGVRARVIRA